jgi:hypothetical protein
MGRDCWNQSTVNDRSLNICSERLLSLTEVERRRELLLRYGTLNIIIRKVDDGKETNKESVEARHQRDLYRSLMILLPS